MIRTVRITSQRPADGNISDQVSNALGHLVGVTVPSFMNVNVLHDNDRVEYFDAILEAAYIFIKMHEIGAMAILMIELSALNPTILLSEIVPAPLLQYVFVFRYA